MRTKDHFEMREYHIDVLEDENDSSYCAEGRPYPIYPSKGGLNPSFLRDIIARLVPPAFFFLSFIYHDYTLELSFFYLSTFFYEYLWEAILVEESCFFIEKWPFWL